MSTVYEKIVAEDLNVGTDAVTLTSPAGGTMTGTQINGASVLPQLTQTEIDALSPSTYILVINTTTQTIQFYNGSAWCEIAHGVL